MIRLKNFKGSISIDTGETTITGVTTAQIESILDSIFSTRTAPEIAALIDASNRRILGNIYGQQATQNVADFLTELGAVE